MSTVHDLAIRPATPQARQELTEVAQEFVIFSLGQEHYAIDILRAQEIRSYEAPTQIPNALPFIKGVINLRGVIVPIFDLRLKFALEWAGYDDSTVVIVVNVADRTLGLVVDAVSDVLQIDSADRRPAPEFSGCADTSFITGIASVQAESGTRMLILVDIERLIAGVDMGAIA
jgi:purine-binding chemotaxis protein CheW